MFQTSHKQLLPWMTSFVVTLLAAAERSTAADEPPRPADKPLSGAVDLEHKPGHLPTYAELTASSRAEALHFIEQKLQHLSERDLRRADLMRFAYDEVWNGRHLFSELHCNLALAQGYLNRLTDAKREALTLIVGKERMKEIEDHLPYVGEATANFSLAWSAVRVRDEDDGSTRRQDLFWACAGADLYKGQDVVSRLSALRNEYSAAMRNTPSEWGVQRLYLQKLQTHFTINDVEKFVAAHEEATRVLEALEVLNFDRLPAVPQRSREGNLAYFYPETILLAPQIREDMKLSTETISRLCKMPMNALSETLLNQATDTVKRGYGAAASRFEPTQQLLHMPDGRRYEARLMASLFEIKAYDTIAAIGFHACKGAPDREKSAMRAASVHALREAQHSLARLHTTVQKFRRELGRSNEPQRAAASLDVLNDEVLFSELSVAYVEACANRCEMEGRAHQSR